MRFDAGFDGHSLLRLVLLASVACTSTQVSEKQPPEQRLFSDHPACDIRDEDLVCKVDADCEYVGTRIEPSGQCCYTACGGGATVNRAAAQRLLPERDRINVGPPRDGCSSDDTKCFAGYPRCTNGRCTLVSR